MVGKGERASGLLSYMSIMDMQPRAAIIFQSCSPPTQGTQSEWLQRSINGYTEASVGALARPTFDVWSARLAFALRTCPLVGFGVKRDAARTNLRTPATSTEMSCDACAAPACNVNLFAISM